MDKYNNSDDIFCFFIGMQRMKVLDVNRFCSLFFFQTIKYLLEN